MSRYFAVLEDPQGLRRFVKKQREGKLRIQKIIVVVEAMNKKSVAGMSSKGDVKLIPAEDLYLIFKL